MLSIFELPNLGDPREFLQKMPDPPSPDRVDRAITRLLELNALAKVPQLKKRLDPMNHVLEAMKKGALGCLVMILSSYIREL